MADLVFDPADVAWVLDAGGLRAVSAAIGRADEIVLDLETTGLNEHHRHAAVALLALTLPRAGERTRTWLVPLAHPESPFLGRWRAVLRRLLIAVRNCDAPLAGHNVKFDCRWGKAQTGIDLAHRIGWDTQISSHLLNENRSNRLKDVAPATFDGLDRWDDFDLTVVGAALLVPLVDLGLYAARDTFWTWALMAEQRDRMRLVGDLAGAEPQTPDETEDARLGRLAVWVAMPTVATLCAVEQRGIVLDRDWTTDTLAEDRQQVTTLTRALTDRYPEAGLDPDEASFAPTSHWFQQWTAAAVERGGLAVTALTPTGRPKWAKAVLVRQARAGSEAAEQLLELRRHTKRCEYLSSWLDCATDLDIVHANYNAGSVVTGRLSSDGPNMQQVTAALKPAFVPTVGHLFVDLDYSQIELRAIAHISGCEPMIEAFLAGRDLHALLASRITGKPEADVNPDERQRGKSANFGLCYGLGAYGFREYAEDVYGVSFTMEEAEAIHRTYFETWTGLREWHARVIHRVRQTGQVSSPIGRVRRLPEVWDRNEKLAMWAERAAINSPVQGFASDLMQIAAASIEGTLPGVEPVAGARIVATVHDSVLVEVPEGRWKETAAACQSRMTDVADVLDRLDCRLSVPLVAEAKVGTRWGLSDVAVLA